MSTRNQNENAFRFAVPFFLFIHFLLLDVAAGREEMRCNAMVYQISLRNFCALSMSLSLGLSFNFALLMAADGPSSRSVCNLKMPLIDTERLYMH